MALNCVILTYDVMMRGAENGNISVVDSLAVLRGVCKSLRAHIMKYRHSPKISHRLFTKHTQSRCAFEISKAIETWPLYEFGLEVKHDRLSRKMRCIAEREILFYQLDNAWSDTMAMEWGVLFPLQHARGMAIVNACNKSCHFKNIHKTYALQPIAIMRLRTYVYTKLVQLADLP